MHKKQEYLHTVVVQVVVKNVSWRMYRETNMYIKWKDTYIKTRVLTICCCAGSGEEGVMEDIKRDKYVHKVEGHMHKNKSTYSLLLCR